MDIAHKDIIKEYPSSRIMTVISTNDNLLSIFVADVRKNLISKIDYALQTYLRYIIIYANFIIKYSQMMT